jgi:heat shock protein HslJ
MFARRLAALVALVGLVAACTAGPGTGGEIEGIQWVLRSYDQAGTLTIVPDTVFADAQFSSYQVSGSSGCNSYKALYQAGGRTLIVGNPSVTLMACDKATMDFEQTFLTLLQSSRFYGVQRDTLTVWNADRTNILVFDAAPRNPLLGRWQVDSFATPSGSVSVPIAGTSLEVTFGLLNVSGFSGCNSFSGTYSTNGNVVRIGGLASTRIACPQDVMDQESAFLAALQGVAFIDYQGSTVLLEDRNNRIQVALVQPQPEASPSGSPSIAPTPGPTASPSAGTTPTPGPTATPTVAPTATPTATPTIAPSQAPSASSSPIPPSATCDLAVPNGGPTVAKIVYPGGWYTPTEPADLVCRYFDPQPITVPTDPTTLQTAVMASISSQAFADAVTAATDPTKWTVTRQGGSSIGGTNGTCIDAVALVDSPGITTGMSSFSCLVDVGTAGTVVIRTTGTATDPTYRVKIAVVGLMTASSAYQPQP